MKVLLDTNSLIWLLNSIDGNQLGPLVKKILADADVVYVSSVSILEIRIKTMLGKLTSDKDLLIDIEAAGLKTLSFTSDHADAITSFPTLSRHDPFDRMLIAQAKTENLLLLTSDKVLLELNHAYVIDSCQ